MSFPEHIVYYKMRRLVLENLEELNFPMNYFYSLSIKRTEASPDPERWTIEPPCNHVCLSNFKSHDLYVTATCRLPPSCKTSSMPLQQLLRHVPDSVTTRLLNPTATTAFVGCFTLWLSLVRVLRWRRYNGIHRKYGSKWNNGLGELLPQEAQEIIRVSKSLDMPWLLFHTYALALFKTYGIVSQVYFRLASLKIVTWHLSQPSISKLLVATEELKSKETVAKRYTDVGLISFWIQTAWGSLTSTLDCDSNL